MAQSLKIRSGQPVSRKELKFCIWAPETTAYPEKNIKIFGDLSAYTKAHLAWTGPKFLNSLLVDHADRPDWKNEDKSKFIVNNAIPDSCVKLAISERCIEVISLLIELL
jgi:hypothetical protein